MSGEVNKYVSTSGHGGMVSVVSNDYSHTYVRHSDYAALARDRDRLREALEAVMPYVATTAIGCHGDKCREPWCYSCFGEESAEQTARTAIDAYDKARAALAGRS